MRKALATILGFVVAPAVATSMFSTFGLVLGAINHELPDRSILQVAEVFYTVASVGAVVFGIPLYFLFKHLQLIRWWSCAAAGFVIGTVMDAAVNHAWTILAIPDLTAYGVMGAASAIVFWLIWKQGRQL